MVNYDLISYDVAVAALWRLYRCGRWTELTTLGMPRDLYQKLLRRYDLLTLDDDLSFAGAKVGTLSKDKTRRSWQVAEFLRVIPDAVPICETLLKMYITKMETL